MSTSIHSMTSISLPDEIYLYIFSFLNADELIKAGRVNTLFNKLSSQNFLWEPLTLRISPTLALDLIKWGCKDWKKTYVVTLKKAKAINKQAQEKLIWKSDLLFNPRPVVHSYEVYLLPFPNDSYPLTYD